MARASEGKHRHRMGREIRMVVVAQWVYKSSHRRKAHEKERGNRLQLPSLCLLMKPGAGVFIHRVWLIQVLYVQK